MHKTPLNLHTHLFSCLKLKHLELDNCCFPPMPSFRGFPNLLSLDLSEVGFGRYKCGEFLTQCPLLEILKISNDTRCEMKLVEIEKLENLKVLVLPFCKLENMGMITSSCIFQLTRFFPKLEELSLDLLNCKVLADAEKMVQTALPCLKTLGLCNIDFRSDNMVSCAIELICGFPNLKVLMITGATYNDPVPQLAVGSSVIDDDECTRMGQLQLREVGLFFIKGLENEACLIKSLLANSPLLKKMTIRGYSSQVFGGDSEEFATKLLKLHRASTTAEIDIHL